MNAWKKYGAHALVYVIGALTLVHAYAPIVLPGKGVVIAAIAAVILGGINHIQQLLGQTPVLPAPAPGTADKQSGRVSLGALSVLISMAAILIGCATIQKIMSSPASAAAVQAAVDVGVGTYIQETAKTPAEQAAKAAQVSAIASALEGVLTGDQATLAQLDQMLQAKIVAANLPPADAAAATILAQTVQAVVLQEIQGNAAAGKTAVLTADQTVAIKAVLDDVIQAASFYDVHARAAVRAAAAAGT